jgi:5-methylcytosine-specific restriction endonuclease McrA
MAVVATKKGDPRLSRKYREVRLRVLAANGYVCFYCGHEGQDGNGLTIDHIIPVSKAPELAISEENMRVACKSCNSQKGSRNERVFLEQRRTPPVFSAFLSPMQSEIHQDSPFTARPVQN